MVAHGILVILGQPKHKSPWLVRYFVKIAVDSQPLLAKFPGLAHAMHTLLCAAWEPSTWATYSSAAKSYFDLCLSNTIVPLPPSISSLLVWTLTLFSTRRLAATTVINYTVALKSACRMLDIDVSAFDAHQLRYVLRGMKKTCPKRFSSQPRLPITIWLLAGFFEVISEFTDEEEVFKAAFTSGVYGLLRSAEFLAKPRNPCPLVRVDLTWHNDYVTLRLRYTKGDTYNVGVLVTLYKNGSPTCPYAHLRTAYDSAVHQSPSAPVFQRKDGSALTYKDVQTMLTKLAVRLHLDPKRFKLHGLRIGGATTLAILGVPAHVIKTIGRWKSLSYQLYTRTSPDQIRSAFHAVGATSQYKARSHWFGGLVGEQSYAACKWGVDGLETIAQITTPPGGEKVVQWSCS